MKLAHSVLASVLPSVVAVGFVTLASQAQAFDRSKGESLMTFKTPVSAAVLPQEIVLKNDSFNDNGGSAYIQQGFVAGEKVGVWLQVPDTVTNFKIDSFRVLMGSTMMTSSDPRALNTQVFFTMGIAGRGGYSTTMPAEIENAADITPGPYFNDIPAVGDGAALRCAKGGDIVGAALEFTHTGLPSVYRDVDGLSNPQKNTLMAIPGGWNYSVAYGLRGDWVLRVVGHEAAAGECL
jgi:hypothetical protein